MYHDNKKGGTIRNLFYPEEPPSTLHVNKHEQSTPNKDVNLHLLILTCFKLAVFRIENKSKSSKIFTNKYEWKRYSKCLYFYIFISIQDTSPHIQSKSSRKNAPCIIVRKVKLLFEATQFNKKKKLVHSFTCVIPTHNQVIGVPQMCYKPFISAAIPAQPLARTRCFPLLSDSLSPSVRV